MLRRKLKVVVGGGALIAVLAAIALLAYRFVAGAGEGPALPGDLLAANRTHFSLCVDRAGLSAGTGAAGGTFSTPTEITTPTDVNTPAVTQEQTSTPQGVTSVEVERVSKAVANALGTLDPTPQELAQPSVAAGCPAPIMLTGERLHFYDLCCGLTKVFTDASKLSPHRIFVYFVPDTAYSLAFGNDRPYAKATAETWCEGDACGEMTVSIYAPESIADDDLANAVLRGLALEPRTPEPTMDWKSCEKGTARPECERYSPCLAASYEELQCKLFWEEWEEEGITPPPGPGGNPSR